MKLVKRWRLAVVAGHKEIDLMNADTGSYKNQNVNTKFTLE